MVEARAAAAQRSRDAPAPHTRRSFLARRDAWVVGGGGAKWTYRPDEADSNDGEGKDVALRPSLKSGRRGPLYHAEVGQLSKEGLKELGAQRARERTGGQGPHCIVQFDVRVNGMIRKAGRPEGWGSVLRKLVQEEPPGIKLKFGGILLFATLEHDSSQW